MIMKRHISAPRARDQCKTSICSISSAVLQPLDATGPSQGGMVAPLVVRITVVKAVVEAVDNNNKRGQRRLREKSPDDSIVQQRILRPLLP